MKFLLKTFLITFTFSQIAMAGRMYDPEIGRFISRDPIGYVDGMSLYNAYFAEQFTVDPYGFESGMGPHAGRSPDYNRGRRQKIADDFNKKRQENRRGKEIEDRDIYNSDKLVIEYSFDETNSEVLFDFRAKFKCCEEYNIVQYVDITYESSWYGLFGNTNGYEVDDGSHGTSDPSNNYPYYNPKDEENGRIRDWRTTSMADSPGWGGDNQSFSFITKLLCTKGDLAGVQLAEVHWDYQFWVSPVAEAKGYGYVSSIRLVDP